jgi:hypothetical protein
MRLATRVAEGSPAGRWLGGPLRSGWLRARLPPPCDHVGPRLACRLRSAGTGCHRLGRARFRRRLLHVDPVRSNRLEAAYDHRSDHVLPLLYAVPIGRLRLVVT